MHCILHILAAGTNSFVFRLSEKFFILSQQPIQPQANIL